MAGVPLSPSTIRACGLAVAFLLVILIAISAAAQGPKRYYTEQELKTIRPTSPNPYVAFLPADVSPDWDYWDSYLRIRGMERSQALSTSTLTKLLNVVESEPNDTQGTAQPLTGFGTGAGDDGAADIDGTFLAPPAPGAVGPFAEDNGSIPLAGMAAITSGNAGIDSAVLGDGPHGSSGSGSGDFDFYEIQNLVAGQVLLVDIDTNNGGQTFDSFVAVWDSAGNLLATNDDEGFPILDSLLSFRIPANDTYYVSVGSFFSPIPLDPFDSSSGLGFGSEGPYDITIGVDYGDFDYYSFELEAGDVLGINTIGGNTGVRLLDAMGDERVGSAQDLSGIYPASSPLPGGGGTSALAYVIEESGTYAVGITNSEAGAYTLEARVFRPELESPGLPNRQILFIDFDGESINTNIFDPFFGGPSVLSPMSAFLTGWGLGAGDQNALIDAILQVVEENLLDDIRFPGGNNPGFDIEIRNSRDHADPFGQSNVSRVIVGGTIAESGIPTIGIAESIDPGNFDGEESALVLLDTLSGDAFDPNSLNFYGIAAGSSKIDLVATGVGNIVAHEAGHYFGNFHTENQLTLPNIMDAGGNMPNTIGVGPDLIIGNEDDTDVDFGPDQYEPSELFTGIEDTLNTVAFGLSTGLDTTNIWIDFTESANGTGVMSFPFNNFTDGLRVGSDGATIHLFSGSTDEVFSGSETISKPLTLVNASPGSGVAAIGTP